MARVKFIPITKGTDLAQIRFLPGSACAKAEVAFAESQTASVFGKSVGVVACTPKLDPVDTGQGKPLVYK